MISETAVQRLLDNLYEYISFKAGDEPNLVRLLELFDERAIIIEYLDKSCKECARKSIYQHIEETINIFKQYPEIKSRGFNEVELHNTITIKGPVAYVESVYEKSYFNGKCVVSEIGINSMHIAKLGEELKIISIGWFQK